MAWLSDDVPERAAALAYTRLFGAEVADVVSKRAAAAAGRAS
jgi:hypothetical protein